MRGDEHKQAGIFAHLQSLDHNGFLEDTEISFIDKTDPSNSTRREEFWIDTLRTRYALGRNKIDTYIVIVIITIIIIIAIAIIITILIVITMTTFMSSLFTPT